MFGPDGPTGLNYSGVRALLDELGLAGEQRTDVFTGICAAEVATLEEWARQRKSRAP